jgi:hypothetical protein
MTHRSRKIQFDLTSTRIKDTTMPAVWMTVLAAQ